MSRKINEIGNRYGRLIVVLAAKSVNGKAMWLCECDCRNEVVVAGTDLRSGGTKSCGCLKSDMKSAQLKKLNSKQLGANHPQYIDGASCGMGTKEQLEFHESIRKRDNYTCQKCGKTQEQELADIDRRLSVHHKDGNHFHNTDENAVTLCESCHQKLEREIRNAKHDAEIQWAVYEMENNIDTH